VRVRALRYAELAVSSCCVRKRGSLPSTAAFTVNCIRLPNVPTSGLEIALKNLGV